jgi:hypothetical protein
MAEFGYLEMTITNQNYIHEDINSRLNLEKTTIILLRAFVFLSLFLKRYD